MSVPGLESLRDIHLPPPPAASDFPWLWLFLALPLLGLLLGLVIFRRPLREFRARRRARGRLARLAEAYSREPDGPRLARDLSALLKDEAGRRFPGAGVARLWGQPWLAFLDRTGGGGFLCGPGAVLADLPYRSAGEVDGPALVALVANWLERARP